jgi:hypothetical protein
VVDIRFSGVRWSRGETLPLRHARFGHMKRVRDRYWVGTRRGSGAIY